MITMLLGGLWHGAGWNFVIWGGLHGLALAFHKMYLGGQKVQIDDYRYNGLSSLIAYIFKVCFLFIFILFTWLFFRTATVGDAYFILAKIAQFIWTPESRVLMQVVFCYYLVMCSLDAMEVGAKGMPALHRLSGPAWVGFSITIWVTIIMYIFSIFKVQPFVYFQF